MSAAQDRVLAAIDAGRNIRARDWSAVVALVKRNVIRRRTTYPFIYERITEETYG